MADQKNQGDEQEIDLAEKLKKAQAEAEEHDMDYEDSEDNEGQDDAMTKLKVELEQMTEMAKRTMADMQNMKRRQEEERQHMVVIANLSLIRSLLPILDNLERAVKHIPESAINEQTKTWFAGLEISTNQLSKVLADAGLKPIESLGQTFNPDFHEALMQGPGAKDIVIEELEKGYILGDRVVRHAKVKVGNS